MCARYLLRIYREFQGFSAATAVCPGFFRPQVSICLLWGQELGFPYSREIRPNHAQVYDWGLYLAYWACLLSKAVRNYCHVELAVCAKLRLRTRRQSPTQH